MPVGGEARELQRALWAAAKQSSGRRFHALFDRVCRGDVLWEAWFRVCRNKGAAGVDRVTLVAVEDYGAWTACCVSCVMTSARVGIARRRRVGWRFRNHRAVRGRWGFPRRWHSHRSSGDYLGFVVVTHPFHPLNGQRLEVLFVKRRGAESVFVCAGGVVGVQVTMPWSWTDRGEPPRPNRLSIEGLADLSAATRAIRDC